ncbi:MAG: hypothetical protein JW712_09840 [Dehalococcoidales bacterium]|nr:hypothetical protein [Dehalococcoidales bacterium]
MGLYDHLIKPLGIKKQKNAGIQRDYNEARKGQETSHGVWVDGRDGLEGMNLSFAWEYHDGTGDWYGDRTPHVHPYPEVQFFVGLDTASINYLGADVECCLGEEMEPHAFSEPTVVVVPAGVPHGPVTTKRMYSPKGYGYYVAALTALHQSEKVEIGGTAGSGSKYSSLVKPLKDNILIQRRKFQGLMSEERPADTGNPLMELGPGNADHLAWMYGENLEGLEVNLDWGFFSSPGLWHRNVGAHIHPVDEILVFIGTDPARGDLLNAEIEIDLGKEHERHLVTEPCIIVCPAGLPHGPFVTHWVDRAYAFFSINLSGQPNMTFID